MTKQLKKVRIAPRDLKLNVDQDFVEFCRNRFINNKTVFKTDETVIVSILDHKIAFIVKECDVEGGTITKDTELRIMKFNTLDYPQLSDIPINIFMTDEKVKKILSDLITNEIIYEKDAIQLWKEFKKYQTKILDD